MARAGKQLISPADTEQIIRELERKLYTTTLLVPTQQLRDLPTTWAQQLAYGPQP